jgi:hypothetical protein
LGNYQSGWRLVPSKVNPLQRPGFPLVDRLDCSIADSIVR